jgi:release factor glutamine methyltransferase
MVTATARSAIVARLRAAGCVFAEDETRLLISAAQTPDELAAMVEQRVAGRPLEHIVGWVEFCGLRINLDPGVFVPRRRSEFLVRQAVRVTTRPPAGPPPVVVDLCCGSGAVGVALATALGEAVVHAVDVDRAAVRCARRNLAAVGGRVYEGDLYEPLPAQLRGGVQILVAVTPYVPTDEIKLLPSEARTYEPRQALDGGADGLDVLRRVIMQAPSWLAPRAHLLVETGAHQARRAVGIASDAGLRASVASADNPAATVVIAEMPAAH